MLKSSSNNPTILEIASILKTTNLFQNAQLIIITQPMLRARKLNTLQSYLTITIHPSIQVKIFLTFNKIKILPNIRLDIKSYKKTMRSNEF